MTVLICKTCPRYAPRASGAFARAFTAALHNASDGDATSIRNVQCLGGCPDNGVAALDAPGKARVRFTGLVADDAPTLLAAATDYDSSETGHPDDWPLPEQLRRHLSSITIKRPAAEPGHLDHPSTRNTRS